MIKINTPFNAYCPYVTASAFRPVRGVAVVAVVVVDVCVVC